MNQNINLSQQSSDRIKIEKLGVNEVCVITPSKSYQIIKRIFDLVLTLLSLPLVLPIMLATALLVKLESRGGVLFTQERFGLGGMRFTIYKFRSMYIETRDDETTGLQDERVTRVGRFIRKTRIDELPQLFNVLKGEMSLIGPRAEFCGFAEEYARQIPCYHHRHVVRPGISGWAQVNQGYNFGIEDTKIKLEYDLYYIKHCSFALDMLIVFKTLKTILTGFGAR